MSNEIQNYQPQAGSVSVFSDTKVFESAQRMATALAASSIVPAEYQGNVANTLVALEMAQRMGESPLMVMQNLNVIHGKPSFGSAFIIGRINTCGKFAENLKFDMKGTGSTLECTAWTKDRLGEIKKGAPVTMKMAVAEGWTTKKGSKWATMPELMIQYRAAAFFCRLHAPELLMGMKTAEEIIDITPVENVTNVSDLNEKLNNGTAVRDDADSVITDAEIVVEGGNETSKGSANEEDYI